MITSHVCAKPLLRKAVVKPKVHSICDEHEDVPLDRLRNVLPKGVKVAVPVDWGLGIQALYEILKDQLGVEIVDRFGGIGQVDRADRDVTDAKDSVPTNGKLASSRRDRPGTVRRDVPIGESCP